MRVGSPELFSVNDFTVPGVANKQGRRQEPCSTPNHLPAAAKRPRFPAAVLLRSAIQKRYTAKVVLGLFERTMRPCILFPGNCSQAPIEHQNAFDGRNWRKSFSLGVGRSRILLRLFGRLLSRVSPRIPSAMCETAVRIYRICCKKGFQPFAANTKRASLLRLLLQASVGRVDERVFCVSFGWHTPRRPVP
jgi:hypothetical protein